MGEAWNLGDSSINVSTIWMIDDDSGSGVVLVVGYIIIHEDDDIFILQSTLLHYLICMADVRLDEFSNRKIALQVLNIDEMGLPKRVQDWVTKKHFLSFKVRKCGT